MTSTLRPAAALDPAVVLHAENVNLVRNGKYLLSGISVTVRTGQHWAVVGPNGAGKSTLLSLLGAQAHPTSGSVHVLGHQLGRVDMQQLRAHIGHVNPRHRLERPLTPREVVLTGLTNTALLPPKFVVTEKHVELATELLGRLGMGERSQTRWPTMSQGERGRVLIARALMSKPRLLLLDEPATGLDIAGREELLDALNSVAAEQPSLSTVLVTHHLEELPTSTSHALMMRAGAELAAGAVSQTLTSTNLSAAFAHPLHVEHVSGRWTVRSAR